MIPIPKKYIIILGLVAALGVLLYLYKGEIVKGAQNAFAAFQNEKTIETNEQSKKDSENVRKEIESFDNRQLDNRLCGLGIVQDNGCKSN